MKIGIIGANGFLGSTLYRNLIDHYGEEIVGITRENYTDCLGKYDVIINANGNSNKYWANNNPLKDFDASVASVCRSMFDFSCGLYVFISSADVYKQSVYGFNKLLAESIVKEYQNNFIILRCSAIVGKNLKKGVMYDALKGSELFVTDDSCIQFISADAIADVIKNLLDVDISNVTLNVGGQGTTSLSHIASLLNCKLLFSPQARYQYYEMNVDKLKELFPLGTSNYYVEEIINERME